MLIGNVGMDPEVRYLENQAKVARLRIATTETFSDRNGERRENTEWHTVTCWRRLADLAEKFIKKGTQVYVEGRLQTREWTDQQGQKRFSTEIVADNIQLLGRRQDGQQQANTPQQSYNPYQQSYQQSVVTPAPAPVVGAPVEPDFGDAGNDDLPF